MPEHFEFTMGFENEGLESTVGADAPLNVKLAVENGKIVAIAGDLEGRAFEGTLHFTNFGGGECIVCGPPPMMCRPVIPCPDGGGGG